MNPHNFMDPKKNPYAPDMTAGSNFDQISATYGNYPMVETRYQVSISPRIEVELRALGQSRADALLLGDFQMKFLKEKHGIEMYEAQDRGLYTMKGVTSTSASCIEVLETLRSTSSSGFRDTLELLFGSLFLDGMVLHAAKRRSHAPNETLAVKWMALQSIRPELPHRDYVFLQYADCFERPNEPTTRGGGGENNSVNSVMKTGNTSRSWVGAHVWESIELDDTAPDPNSSNLIRSNLRRCGFTIEESCDTPDVVRISFFMSETCGRGSTSISSSTRSWMMKLMCLGLEKLTDAVLAMRLMKSITDKTAMSVPHPPRQDCAKCLKRFGVFRRKHTCRVCSQDVCGKCSRTKDLATKRKMTVIRICAPCAQSAPALKAMHQGSRATLTSSPATLSSSSSLSTLSQRSSSELHVAPSPAASSKTPKSRPPSTQSPGSQSLPVPQPAAAEKLRKPKIEKLRKYKSTGQAAVAAQPSSSQPPETPQKTGSSKPKLLSKSAKSQSSGSNLGKSQASLGKAQSGLLSKSGKSQSFGSMKAQAQTQEQVSNPPVNIAQAFYERAKIFDTPKPAAAQKASSARCRKPQSATTKSPPRSPAAKPKRSTRTTALGKSSTHVPASARHSFDPESGQSLEMKKPDMKTRMSTSPRATTSTPATKSSKDMIFLSNDHNPAVSPVLAKHASSLRQRSALGSAPAQTSDDMILLDLPTNEDETKQLDEFHDEQEQDMVSDEELSFYPDREETSTKSSNKSRTVRTNFDKFISTSTTSTCSISSEEVDAIESANAVMTNTAFSYALSFSNKHPWPRAPIPPRDSTRCARVQSLLLNDQDGVFYEMCQLASTTLECPVAVICFVGLKTGTMVSKIGIDDTKLPRELLFEAHTIMSVEPTIVLDTSKDVRFVHHPLVTTSGSAKVRFYAGFPLVTSEDRQVVGSLSVADTKIRASIPGDQVFFMKNLASLIIRGIEKQTRECATFDSAEAFQKAFDSSLPDEETTSSRRSGSSSHAEQTLHDLLHSAQRTQTQVRERVERQQSSMSQSLGD